MKATEQLTTRWKAIREPGDLRILSRKIKMAYAGVSQIIHGKRETTVSVIAKIDKFIARKESKQKFILDKWEQ